MSALAIVPKPNPANLWVLEDYLVELLDNQATQPEDEAQFLEHFAAVLTAEAAEVDSVAQFMSHLETQIAASKAERDRLSDREAGFESALTKLKSDLAFVIETMGRDAAGKYRKLAGNLVTFSIRKCPQSVDVVDARQIPAQFRNVTVKLSAELWERILDGMEFDLGTEVLNAVKVESIVSKTAILKANREVAGAVIVSDKYSLVRT